MTTNSYKKLATFVGVLVVVSTIMPYVYGGITSEREDTFLYSRVNNSYDFPTYIAWIEQAKQGELFFKDLYSSEEQPRSFFNPLFFSAGVLANILQVSATFAFHLSRIALAGLLLFVGYKFIKLFARSEGEVTFTFLLFSLGAGLGWIFGSPSVDIIQSEATNFLTMYESLINTTSLLLILASFYYFTLLVRNNDKELSKKYIFLIALFLNLLTLVHGYDTLLMLTVIGVYTAYLYLKDHNKNLLITSAYIVLLSFPAILWQAWLLNSNPALGVWASLQTFVPAQKPLAYLATYGILLVLSLTSFIKEKAENSNRLTFLFIWFVLLICFLFNPITDRFQQKLSLGIFVPLSIMSGFLIWWVVQNTVKNQSQKAIFALAILAPFVATNFYVAKRDFDFFKQQHSTVYYPSSYKDAFDWIKVNVSTTAVLLSGPKLSNLLPAFTGRTVFYGHYDQTINARLKQDIVLSTFASTPKYSDPLKSLVKDYEISYVVIDSTTRATMNYPVESAKFLRTVFSNQGVTIYEVMNDKL